MKKTILTMILLLFSISTTVSATSYTVNGVSLDNGFPVFHAYRSPLRGDFEYNKVNAVFNEPRSGRFHMGVDFKTRDDSTNIWKRNVYPMYSGEVYGKGTSSAGIKYIILKHTVDYYTFYSSYLHLDSFSVNVGDYVSATTPIGISGDTGSTGSPHLRFEVNSYSPTYLSSYRTAYDVGELYDIVDKMGIYNHNNTWVDSLSAVKDVTISNGVLYMTIWGRYAGSNMGPSTTPKIYWRYEGNSDWQPVTMTKTGTYTYKWDFPTSSDQIQYILYFKSKWYNGYSTYDSHYPAYYKDAAEHPDNWSSVPWEAYKTIY